MELTVSFHIGNKQVESLSGELINKMSERLTETMSLYYTAHPDEYLNLKGERNENSCKKNKKEAYQM